MSMEKFKRFLTDRKNELIATTAVVGGVVLVILGCKHRSKKASKTNGIFRMKDISIPDASRSGTRPNSGWKADVNADMKL